MNINIVWNEQLQPSLLKATVHTSIYTCSMRQGPTVLLHATCVRSSKFNTTPPIQGGGKLNAQLRLLPPHFASNRICLSSYAIFDTVKYFVSCGFLSVLLVFWSNKMQGLDCNWFSSQSKMTRPNSPCRLVAQRWCNPIQLWMLRLFSQSAEHSKFVSFCWAVLMSHRRCGAPLKGSILNSPHTPLGQCKAMLHFKKIETLMFYLFNLHVVVINLLKST